MINRMSVLKMIRENQETKELLEEFLFHSRKGARADFTASSFRNGFITLRFRWKTSSGLEFSKDCYLSRVEIVESVDNCAFTLHNTISIRKIEFRSWWFGLIF